MLKHLHARPWLVQGLLVFAGLGALAAHADTLTQRQVTRVENRQEHQAERIDQGVASGQLTRPEQARLDMQQGRIDRMEGRALADGKVTGREAVHIERAQDKASRRIALNKHDRQHRPLAVR